MNYNEEFLKYQKIYERTLKKKYSSIKKVELSDLDTFISILEKGYNFPLERMDADITWNVREAIQKGESFEKLGETGENIFKIMFGLSGVFPWVNLITID
jgi:hypothetical protein